MKKFVSAALIITSLCYAQQKPAQNSAPVHQYATPNAPLLGAAWYPEQWPEERWDADLALMEKGRHDGHARR